MFSEVEDFNTRRMLPPPGLSNKPTGKSNDRKLEHPGFWCTRRMPRLISKLLLQALALVYSDSGQIDSDKARIPAGRHIIPRFLGHGGDIHLVI